MNWKFYINESEIEEPAGFNDFIISVKRDENWKGIFFEASANSLQFYGEAFDILKNLKQTQGFKAMAIFKATYQCEESAPYEEAIRGKLNFGQYKEQCGDQCFITMPVEQDNCTMILRNRYDQKVNIEEPKSFNRTTLLPVYAALNNVYSLPTFAMPVAVRGTVGTDQVDNYNVPDYPIGGMPNDVAVFDFRPSYYNQVENSIATGELVPSNSSDIHNTPNDIVISPQLLLEEPARCTNGTMDYTFRLKGNYNFNLHPNGYVGEVFLTVYKFDGYTRTYLQIFFLVSPGGQPPNVFGTFDHTFTGTVTLKVGESLGATLVGTAGGTHDNTLLDANVTFEPEASCDIRMARNCPPTDAMASMVNELAARIAESITDLCITVKSNYYGRIDSEPFAMPVDGCGGLRIITNGLKVRQADKNSEFFCSLKDLFEGLNAIDNIGIGIEDDPSAPDTDKKILRLEDARYFFQNTEIMVCDFVPNALTSVLEQNVYAKISIGYDKYESGQAKGTDEYCAAREFRTSIDATDNVLQQLCRFIAGTYPIEFTRQQQFIETGEADTRYDNEAFIICMARQYGGIEVEQGNIDSASNMLAPATMYNWRIRPLYNLMRWAKSIFQAYVNLLASDAKIFFTSGVGNYTATGELPVVDGCRLESGAMAENTDLSIEDFDDVSEAVPILRAESIQFDYPLSIAEYKRIKANPYGYIAVQCGTSETLIKCFISSIEYRVADGLATFNLFVASTGDIPVVVLHEFKEGEFSSEFA